MIPELTMARRKHTTLPQLEGMLMGLKALKARILDESLNIDVGIVEDYIESMRARITNKQLELRNDYMTMNEIPTGYKPCMYMYPEEDIDGRMGMYCTKCNMVIYVTPPASHLVRDRPCPICGGRVLWITSSYQPKHYGD